MLYGQSGGTTRVINSSGWGVIEQALNHPDVGPVLWAENGIKGILSGRLFDMRKEDPEELKLLLQTPGAAFGSCRKKLSSEEQLAQVIDVLKKYNVRYFFYNGGNDSMDTCNKVHEYAQKVGYEMRVMGIPKTIDNDLAGTDHTPGYGSVAKYIATTRRDLEKGYSGVYGEGEPITVVETMGRNAGWIAAASALGAERESVENVPHHIYLPEVPFDVDKFIQNTIELQKKSRVAIAYVSEGVQDEEGKYIFERAHKADRDEFGHVKTGGLATFLADELRKHTKTRVKSVELGPLQLCQGSIASQADITEAYNAGKIAFESAMKGMSGKMVAFKCTREPNYKCEYVTVPLSVVANEEQKIPLEWIDTDNNYVTDECIDYMRPLIQGNPKIECCENGLQKYPKLKKIGFALPSSARETAE